MSYVTYPQRVAFSSLSEFPAQGSGSFLYIATDENKIYRWNGSAYVEISSSSPEADTLQSVTDRGATTTNNITANAFIAPTVYTDTISSLFGNPGLSISNKALYDGISTSLSWQDRVTYDTYGAPSTNWENRQLLDSSGIPSIAWQGREAYDSSGITSFSWSGRAFYDNSGITSINWQGRELTNSLGRTVYGYELNLMYAFSGSQHAVIDVGNQILYDIADQSSIRWSTRDIYASDGSTVVANYTNSSGMRLYGSIGTGFSSGSFTQSARIHAHSLTGIATYQKTTNSTTGALSTDGFDVGISASGVAEIRQRENLALEIYTNNNLQATMSATGNFGIGVVPSAKLHIRAGTSAAGTAPLKYVSGPLLTTPEVGAQEFLTDKYYATISTGTARKEFTLNDIALTAGRVPYTTTNGRMTDSANLTFNGFNLTQKGQINSITFVTGTYSVLTSDCYMFCPTGGAFTVTLPTAVGRSGQAYTVHNSSTGVTTIATTSSQTINGALTVVLSTRYSSRTVVSDGSNWFITALV